MIATQQMIFTEGALISAGIGSIHDLCERRIPNLLTGPAILIALALHAVYGGWSGLASSALAGLIAGAIFLIFYLAGGMGAGDVKLIAAVGCLAGLSNTAYLLVLTSLAGGAMGIVFALMRGRLKETLLNVGEITTHHRKSGLKPHPDLNVRNGSTLRLPYGVAIAAGSSITFYLLGMQR